MSDNNCYNPIKGVDDKIADRVPSWNSHYVANLRGIYDEQHDTPLQTENISEAVNTLLKFRRGDEDENHKRAFVWNILSLIWTMTHLPNMNDLAVYTWPEEEEKSE